MSVRMRISMAETGSSTFSIIGTGHSSLPAQGQIYFTRTQIRVEWQWLSLPLLLVILTLLFMGTVMINTNINGRKPLGDAFSLALLYITVTGNGESGKFPNLRPEGFLQRLWQRLLGKGRRKQQGVGRETVEEVKIQMRKIGDGSWRVVKN
jgi:hypothetical protein